MKEHPLILLAGRYPQLSLPIAKGMRNTEQYKESVLRGKPTGLKPEFSFSDKDVLTSEITPAGSVDVLFLSDREDFEHMIRALAYRCEPADIPASMGATTLSGLINWKKIRPHMSTDEEFSRFISDKSNYLDSIIILSAGNYSAIPPEKTGLSSAEWIQKSVTIRKFHELAHFTSRHMFAENKDAIRDEIVADMIGLFAAFGEYDPYYAKLFLGTEGNEYRQGGRLENYISSGDDIEVVMKNTNELILLLKKVTESVAGRSVFDILQFVENNGFGLNR